MGEPERFFFLHLQKTGGTALFQRLRDCFGAHAVYPTPEDHGDIAAVLDLDHLTRRFAARRDDLRVVTGHFPLCTPTILGAPFTTFTVVRDPIERTLSVLRRRQAWEERYRGHDLDRIYDDPPLRPFVRNHMVKMLALRPEEVTATPLTMDFDVDEYAVARAKAGLSTIAVVGLQERFDELCDELTRRFGWDLGAPRFANRTEPQTVSPALRDRIASDNEADIELYRFAVELVAERARSQADG